MDEHGEASEFSLVRGGPFYALLRRLHLLTPAGAVRSGWLAVFAWLPIVLAAAARSARGLPLDPTLLDLSLHVRLLVALPVLFISERVLERACRSGVRSMDAGGVCEATALRRVVATGEHLRELAVPEALAAMLALAGGQLVLWRITGATGVFSGGTEADSASFLRIWYACVALPLAQFVMYRWLWRWAIWSYMLARIAALRLDLLATHPDRAAGLACLARPLSGFAVFAFAIGAVLSAAWGTQVLAGRTTPPALLTSLLTFVLVVVTVAVSPLLLFCGHLFRARRRTLAVYGDFASTYVRNFHRKWVAAPSHHGDPLGSPDIQSLNDLGGAFEVPLTMRLFPFGMRSVLAVCFGALLPAVPLYLSQLSAQQVMKRIASALLGGFPL